MPYTALKNKWKQRGTRHSAVLIEMFYMADEKACTKWFTFHTSHPFSSRAYNHATGSHDEQCEKHDVEQNPELQKIPKAPRVCQPVATKLEELAVPSSFDGFVHGGMGEELGKGISNKKNTFEGARLEDVFYSQTLPMLSIKTNSTLGRLVV